MNEEEKIAMKLAKDFTKIDFKTQQGWHGYYDEELEELSKSIKTILNLIEKQQKEIELAKQRLIENADIADERNQLLVELQKKDKMIDLMAEKINNFRDELDMLRNFEKDCFIPREYSDINDCIKKESCKQCIIEYYSKKVGE